MMLIKTEDTLLKFSKKTLPKEVAVNKEGGTVSKISAWFFKNEDFGLNLDKLKLLS